MEVQRTSKDACANSNSITPHNIMTAYDPHTQLSTTLRVFERQFAVKPLAQSALLSEKAHRNEELQSVAFNSFKTSTILLSVGANAILQLLLSFNDSNDYDKQLPTETFTNQPASLFRIPSQTPPIESALQSSGRGIGRPKSSCGRFL